MESAGARPGAVRELMPVLLAPDEPDAGRLVHDLLGVGAPVPALPRVAFVMGPDGEPLLAEGGDPWLADVRKVRSVAVANLTRTAAVWTDVRDESGAVVAVALEGPQAPARLLDRSAILEATRLVGAQEVWLAWTGPERLEAVDAWRAPVGPLGDALRARTRAGVPVLIARKGRLVGVLGPDGVTLPLPDPDTVGESDGVDGPPPPSAKGGVLIVLFFLLVGLAAGALAVATT